ncbi:MFS transporter [Macrococcus brunensis]|uniref:MFS transporter n=1 Tax=Macrococcus brunensis TaxID=198483 RepID=UPI0026878446
MIKNRWLLLIGIIFVAATLRSPLTAVGPMINEIKETLAINDTLAGFLTTIPLIIFGLVSPFVSKVVNRLGMSQTIFYAILLLVVGLIIRVSGGIGIFMLGTILMGIAIAISNVTLPSYVKWAFPLQIGLATGIYSTTMNLTAGFGAGASYPLYEMSDLGIKLSLGFWVVFAVIAAIIWLPQLTGKIETRESLYVIR